MMRNKLLWILIVLLAFAVIGCRDNNPPPPPLPTDYIEIPNYVTSPDRIEYWHKILGSRWVSDRDTTGYEDYRFTPIEFTLNEIPDANKPGTTIKKRLTTGIVTTSQTSTLM